MFILTNFKNLFSTNTLLVSELKKEILNLTSQPLRTTFFNMSGLFYLKWLEIRTNYLLNSWAYTTNHKRIGVNYINFVYVAGTAGLSLATVMRIEFAYPGVSFLAGDSIQYLSIAAAHGVIMVFFMIMPSLFGAFGNFLLPTQLGVHDVAFPRLNSAAFWFLPGGLIMLCHTICVDRKYQNLNLFNVREFNSILVDKFMESATFHNDFREALNSTNLGLRYRLGSESMIEGSLSLIHTYGTLDQNLSRSFMIKYNNYAKNLPENVLIRLISPDYFLLTKFGSTTGLTALVSYSFYCLVSYFQSILIVTISYLYNLCYSISTLISPYGRIINDISHFVGNPYINSSKFTSEFVSLTSQNTSNSTNVRFLAQSNDDLRLLKFSNTKTHGDVRYNPTDFSKIVLDIKYGYYSLKYLNRYPLMLPSFLEVHKVPGQYNLRLFHNYKFLEELQVIFNVFVKNSYTNQKLTLDIENPITVWPHIINTFSPELDSNLTLTFTPSLDNSTTSLTNFSNWLQTPTNVSVELAHYVQKPMFTAHLDQVSYPQGSTRFNKAVKTSSKGHDFNNVDKNALDNIMNSLISSEKLNNELNSRYIAFNLLDQKYNLMFNTITLQQKILNRWRTLKFSREAWRCRLLASRNQNTFISRRGGNEGFTLVCLRNAKDLIPGWAMVTPFSSRTRYTAVGKIDVGLAAVFLAINASIISSVNFLVTYRYLSTLNNRKMRDARSFFTESVIVASWMMVAANPMLAIGILMLLADRHWRTSFFDFSGGGDAVLFQHMFWFFGHPEVYVIMIPVFGFTNTILSFYLRKRISARASLLYSMYTIAFLGFWVWGHHMYMVGLSHTTRMLFSTLTVMISVPAATKIMHWCVTIVNSAFIVEIPLMYAFLFIFFFISGGISGMAVAHTGMDILFHDTFYVIGHFHVMLAGAAMFGIFGAIYFYFPALYGVRFSRIFAYIHFIYYLFGQILTVVPMFWLGYCGMPRRVFDYPYVLGGWHSLATSGHLLSLGAMIAFFIMIYDSVRRTKPAIRKTFGPARFNTRLNFFLYEISRLKYINGGTQGATWLPADRERTMLIHESRLIRHLDIVATETTLFTYQLINKK